MEDGLDSTHRHTTWRLKHGLLMQQQKSALGRFFVAGCVHYIH